MWECVCVFVFVRVIGMFVQIEMCMSYVLLDSGRPTDTMLGCGRWELYGWVRSRHKMRMPICGETWAHFPSENPHTLHFVGICDGICVSEVVHIITAMVWPIDRIHRPVNESASFNGEHCRRHRPSCGASNFVHRILLCATHCCPLHWVIRRRATTTYVVD